MNGIKEGAWISVSERLPHKCMAVIVARSCPPYVDGHEYYDPTPGSRGFYDEGEQDTNVTHWMPLPDPPK